MTETTTTTTNDKLRAKARWSILRHALLSGNNYYSANAPAADVSSSPSPSSSYPHHHDHYYCNGMMSSGQQQQLQLQQQHSMNSFPGFRVLERTVVLPKPPTTTTAHEGSTLPTTTIIAATNVETTTASSPFATMMMMEDHDSVVGAAAAAGETNNDSRSGEICRVQYAYKPPSASPAPPPLSSLQVSFVTRETTQRPSKSNIHKRIEGLLSHRIYNGVDNTGNVRVWDAEMTLAGFLLDVIASKMEEEEEEDDLCNNDVGGGGDEKGEDAVGLSRLRNQLRSTMMMSTTACTPPPAIIDDEDDPARTTTTTTTTTTSSRTNPPSAAEPILICNVLELGAGQAGLAGLALTAASSNAFAVAADDRGSGLSERMKPCRVILTDGHPKCVENNRICVDLTRNMMIAASSKKMNEVAKKKGTNAGRTTRFSAATECKLLLWDSSPNGAEACRRINALVPRGSRPLPTPVDSTLEPTVVSATDEGKYHLCLASDCVHFQEFHDGLFTTIARTLAVGGIALLCQPKRGTSLNNFIELIGAVNKGSIGTIDDAVGENLALFDVTLYEEFHPKVSAMHEALVAECSNNNHARDTNDCLVSSSNSTEEKIFIERWSNYYDPNWHLPLLLVLRKLRSYEEDIDGELARQHVKNRVAGR